jgi:hypothetical protein
MKAGIDRYERKRLLLVSSAVWLAGMFLVDTAASEAVVIVGAFLDSTALGGGEATIGRARPVPCPATGLVGVGRGGRPSRKGGWWWPSSADIHAAGPSTCAAVALRWPRS